MTTNTSQNIVQTVTIGTLAATLAAGSYLNFGTAGAIDNTGTAGSKVSGDLVDFFLTNIGTIVTGTAAASVTLALIDSSDGTNYATPGTLSQAAPLNLTVSTPFDSSITLIGTVELPDIPVRPYKCIPLMQNNLGVTLPIGTVLVAKVKNIVNY